MTAATSDRARTRRPPTFGPEPWAQVAGRDWTHWDLWFCMVAVREHEGRLDGLEARLATDLQHLNGRDAAEAKLSHLADLRSRLADAGLTPADLASPEAMSDKTVLTRAGKKVAESNLDGRAKTRAMVETPRVRFDRRARYGHWRAFPVDPAGYYTSFQRQVEGNDYISKYRSFAVVTRLEKRLRSLDTASLTDAQRLALYRAFHTAALELADRTDDSHGNLGQLRADAWHSYLQLDWQAAGMWPQAYWADLCDLVVSENYGLGYRERTLPWENVPAEQVDLVENLLRDLEDECRAHYLDYEADEARQQRAWLAIAGERFARYVDLATCLGSDHWQPIESLAKSALRRGRPDLAVEVFRAADQPGDHREYLRKRCVELTGVRLAAQPDAP